MSALAITKDDLVAVLTNKLPVAKAYDAERMAAHRKVEAAKLTEFRQACREAIKWDYTTARKHNFAPVDRYALRADCPILMAARIERAIARLKVDGRKRLTLDSRGRDSDLFELATWDPTLPSLEGC